MTASNFPPNPPRRRQLLLWALGFTAFVAYGLVIPLDFTPLGWQEACAEFRDIPFLELSLDERADWVASILMFMPIGFLWMSVFCVDKRGLFYTILVTAGVTAACLAFNIAMEFTQLWFPPRTVSQNDIAAETVGSALGVIAWIALGQWLIDFLRAGSAATLPKQYRDWLLKVYFLGFVIYAVMPLDLVLSRAEFEQKVNEGKILLLPFAGLSGDLESCYRLVSRVLFYLPIGMFAATAYTPASRPLRSLPRSILLGFGITLAIEVSKLCIYSRYSSTTNVLTGTLGAGLGAWIIWSWRGGEGVPRVPAGTARNRPRVWLWLAAAALYAVTLIVVSCFPFELLHDQARIAKRFHNFFQAPFVAMYWDSKFHALSQILQKMLSFAVLGGILCVAIATWRSCPQSRRWLQRLAVLATGGLAFAIEMLKVYFPPHVPDCTSVLLCTTGAWLGVVIAGRLLSSLDPPGTPHAVGM